MHAEQKVMDDLPKATEVKGTLYTVKNKSG